MCPGSPKFWGTQEQATSGGYQAFLPSDEQGDVFFSTKSGLATVRATWELSNLPTPTLSGFGFFRNAQGGVEDKFKWWIGAGVPTDYEMQADDVVGAALSGSPTGSWVPMPSNSFLAWYIERTAVGSSVTEFRFRIRQIGSVTTLAETRVFLTANKIS